MWSRSSTKITFNFINKKKHENNNIFEIIRMIILTMLWRYGRAKSSLNSVVLCNGQDWLQRKYLKSISFVISFIHTHTQ